MTSLRANASIMADVAPSQLTLRANHSTRQLEHHLLRGRLDTLKADSEGAQLLEGIIVLGGVLNRKLTHLLGLCRDVGGL